LASAQVTLVNNTQCHSTLSAICNFNTTGATALVAIGSSQYNGNNFFISSNLNLTGWTPLTLYDTGNGGSFIQIFYICGPVTGSDVVTLGGANYVDMTIYAIGGTALTGCFDSGTDVGNISTSGTSLATGSATTSKADFVVTGWHATPNSTCSAALISGGFTLLNFLYNDADGNCFGDGYLIQSAAGSVNPSWSWTGNSNTAVALAGFLPSTTPGVKRHND
jgi:hypothetical protein